MMLFYRTRSAAAILLVFLVTGCAGLVKPDIAEKTGPAAEAAVARIKDRNAGVPTYKGIGEIRVSTPDDAWSVRGAWSAAPDGRFRVEPLGLTGQPLAKMICDYEACHFQFIEDGCLKVVKSGAKSIDPLTGVAIDINDLILLLGGGIPIRSHAYAWIEPSPEEDSESVLVLAGRLGSPVEKIFFSQGTTDIDRLEVYGWKGLIFRAHIGSAMVVDGHRMPGELRIENEDPAGLSIKVERSWAGMPVSDELFSTDLPENNRCE